MTEYINMWKNYVNFTDRTTVRGYWMAFLFHVIAVMILFTLTVMWEPFSFLYFIYSLAIFVPSLSIMVRRLRDAGKHWVNIFWPLLPFIGIIILIVLLCKSSVEDDGVPVV